MTKKWENQPMLVEPTDKKIPFECEELNYPKLLKMAKSLLPLHGRLEYDEVHPYCYVKANDDFIYKLFPLITHHKVQMPNYFSPPKMAGAHITVVYANEPRADDMKQDIKMGKIGSDFNFSIENFIKVSAFQKSFYALTVYSPELEELRSHYDLSVKPNYYGLLVPFHITIAI